MTLTVAALSWLACLLPLCLSSSSGTPGLLAWCVELVGLLYVEALDDLLHVCLRLGSWDTVVGGWLVFL